MPDFEDRTDPEDQTFSNSNPGASGDADQTPSAFSDDTWDDWYARHLVTRRHRRAAPGRVEMAAKRVTVALTRWSQAGR